MALIRDDLGQRAVLIEPIKFSPREVTGEVPQPTQRLDVTQLVELAAVISVNTVLLHLVANEQASPAHLASRRLDHVLCSGVKVGCASLIWPHLEG